MPDNRPPEIRRAARVLAMVGELHKRGYQRLRAVGAMSASGAYWRCWITPASNILRTHGARMVVMEIDDTRTSVLYSSGQGNKYFDWKDRTGASARELADTFLERFPEVCEAGRGPDWAYAGWYVEMLGHAEDGWLPEFYADYGVNESHGVWFTSHESSTRPMPTLPLPPPGEVADPGWPQHDPDGEDE